MYTYIYICVYTYVPIEMYVEIDLDIDIHVRVHMLMHTGVSQNSGPLLGSLCNKDHSILMSVLGPLIFGNSHINTHMRMYACVWIYMYMCICTYTDTFMFLYKVVRRG